MSTTTYSTGTVSVGAGSTAVTGVGTAWLTGGIRAGDRLVLAGLTARIASVNSNTSITLARGWPGSAQSGADYDIWLEDDGVRSLVAANALLQSLGAGTLTSLGALEGAANLMPYWTGAGVMNTTALTAAGRALLDDADAAAMRATLELVKATSATDTTSSRIPLVGFVPYSARAFFGGYWPNAADRNIDTVPEGDVGLYGTGNPGTWPVGLGTFAFLWVETQKTYTGSKVQDATLYYSSGTPSASGTVRWVRISSNTGIWGAWRRVYDSGGLLGTVSQSGGIPTGAVIERGSNANGEYVRLADGTQICTSATLSTPNANTAFGQLFESPLESWTFPAAFASAPFAVFRGTGTRTFGTTAQPTTTSCSFRMLSPVVLNGTQNLAGVAIGRWF